MSHYGQHAVCAKCDSAAAGVGGNRTSVAMEDDGSVCVTRTWWSRGSCQQSFRVEANGEVYDLLFAPRRIDAGASGYVSVEDRKWATFAAQAASRLWASGEKSAVYRD